MSDYATTDEIRAFAQQPDSLGGGPDDTSWALLATSASRLFDNLAEVDDSFFAGQGDTPAFTNQDFIGDGTAYLKLAPYTALNTVTPVLINDGTTAAPNFTATNVPDYIEKTGMLVVLDKTNQNFRLVLPDANRFQGWPDGVQIRVSAKWGFSAVPSDIKLAVIQIALYMFRGMDPATTVITNTEKAVNQANLPTFVTETAKQYKALYSRNALFV